MHSDWTGMRIDNRTQWLHTVSSSDWTLYQIHEKRGKEAINDHGILPVYQGILVHDCWESYFATDYSFYHALCGAHLLRECQGIIDYDGHKWAADMQELLKETWHETKNAREEKIPIATSKIATWFMRYDAILDQGEKEWHTPPDPGAPVKRGRKKKKQSREPGRTLRLHKTAILRFIQDDRVPFDNSLAERDIRMVKVKQKISGSFRTTEGAERFARIRGFISTIQKQKKRYSIPSFPYRIKNSQFRAT